MCEKSVSPWPIKFSSVLTVGFEVIRKQENPLASASRLLGINKVKSKLAGRKWKKMNTPLNSTYSNYSKYQLLA